VQPDRHQPNRQPNTQPFDNAKPGRADSVVESKPVTPVIPPTRVVDTRTDVPAGPEVVADPPPPRLPPGQVRRENGTSRATTPADPAVVSGRGGSSQAVMPAQPPQAPRADKGAPAKPAVGVLPVYAKPAPAEQPFVTKPVTKSPAPQVGAGPTDTQAKSPKHEAHSESSNKGRNQKSDKKNSDDKKN
jgi:hypothetical protein